MKHPVVSTSRSGDDVFEFAGLEVRQQPDDVTCGPTCLQAVYAYNDHPLPLDEVISSVRKLEHGGTLGVLLGLDALERGFDATLYTNNLDVFDPTWFGEVGRPQGGRSVLIGRLRQQLEVREESQRRSTIRAYVDFLEQGGEVRHDVLTPDLLEAIVREGYPPVTGLSATYLYGCEREVYDGKESRYDDVHGEPVGHFVVVSGVDARSGHFRISDPSQDNPRHGSGTYWVSPHRLIGAIFLGVTTYDGNLLVIRPREPST